MTLDQLQVWALIGVFGAAVVGMFTIGFGSLRNEMRSIRNEMQAMRNELITRMDAGFESVNSRIDYLDRDVQFLMRKEFGENPSN